MTYAGSTQYQVKQAVLEAREIIRKKAPMHADFDRWSRAWIDGTDTTAAAAYHTRCRIETAIEDSMSTSVKVAFDVPQPAGPWRRELVLFASACAAAQYLAEGLTATAEGARLRKTITRDSSAAIVAVADQWDRRSADAYANSRLAIEDASESMRGMLV